MQISRNSFMGSLRRWRERLRATTRQFDVDFTAAGKDRQYELWACAMAPELVSLAALMALAEDDPPPMSRGLFSAGK
ncbi:MAG: hypothetical protein L0210_04095 [Rhodospirillales bacterium]|nr:hypothetical protein [Rhodospirillales bacterium]